MSVSLLPFQQAGAKWLSERSAALLADDIGLGKVAQALAAIPAGASTLVVCPSYLKNAWSEQAFLSRPEASVHLVERRKDFRWPDPNEIAIASYDILASHYDCSYAGGLESIPKGLVVIGDEAHLLKNAKSSRSSVFRNVSAQALKRAGRTWLLTSTPLLVRPPELWNVLQAANLAHETFGNWDNFAILSGVRENRFGGFEWGTPTHEFYEILKRVMLRRRREQVVSELLTP